MRSSVCVIYAQVPQADWDARVKEGYVQVTGKLRDHIDQNYFEDEVDFCAKCTEHVNPEYEGDPTGEHKVIRCVW
jgi:hypothetical protein